MKISGLSSCAGSLVKWMCLVVAMMGFSAPLPAQAQADEPAVRVYMPDGQVRLRTIRVYVTRDLDLEQNQPHLELLRRTKTEKERPARLVASGQEWSELADGEEITRSGTLLMFDVGQMDFGLWAMTRVMPKVSWTEEGEKRIAVGASEVNLANRFSTFCWTAAIVVLALGLVIGLAKMRSGNPLVLLTGAHGHLSLAQTQIACWTVVVGGIVLSYGFVQLMIPEIPASLLALMGASLTTGGVAYFQDKAEVQRAAGQRASENKGDSTGRLSVGDLVRSFTPGGWELSLAKAQMLFWTVLLIVLFLFKSINEGAIWAVPWPLVALMGFSQAGYLAPKLAQPTKEKKN